MIKITRSKNPSNLPPCPPSPLISSFVRISMRLEGNRNYAWRLFIKLIAPSSLILPSPRPPFPFSISNWAERYHGRSRKIGRSPSRPAALRWRAARTSVRNCASLCASDLTSRMQAAFLRDTRWFEGTARLDEGIAEHHTAFHRFHRDIIIARWRKRCCLSFIFFPFFFFFDLGLFRRKERIEGVGKILTMISGVFFLNK